MGKPQLPLLLVTMASLATFASARSGPGARRAGAELLIPRPSAHYGPGAELLIPRPGAHYGPGAELLIPRPGAHYGPGAELLIPRPGAHYGPGAELLVPRPGAHYGPGAELLIPVPGAHDAPNSPALLHDSAILSGSEARIDGGAEALVDDAPPSPEFAPDTGMPWWAVLVGVGAVVLIGLIYFGVKALLRRRRAGGK